MNEMSIRSSQSLREEKLRRTCDFLNSQGDTGFSLVPSPVMVPNGENSMPHWEEGDLRAPAEIKMATSTPRNVDPPTNHQSLPHNSDHNNNTPCVGTELTKFLDKEELLLSCLFAFNDKPENSLMWKGSFSIIMTDLSVTPMKERDLLLKYLRPESSQQATVALS